MRKICVIAGRASPPQTAPILVKRLELSRRWAGTVAFDLGIRVWAAAGGWDTPEQFGAFIAAESERWGKVIRAAGIELQ